VASALSELDVAGTVLWRTVHKVMDGVGVKLLGLLSAQLIYDKLQQGHCRSPGSALRQQKNYTTRAAALSINTGTSMMTHLL